MNVTRLFLLFVLSTLVGFANAQVVVNEFCTANYSDWNVGGELDDWIEFYNPTAAAADISGYWLSDNPSNPQKWEFPAGSTVPANGFLVVLFSGTGDYDPNYLGYRNTNFRVTQTDGETILFSNTSGTVLESYDLSVIGAFQANHSYARITDGGADWAIHTNPSPESANSGATYQAYTSTPIINIEAGYKTGPINVTIDSEPGSSVYYTLDGSEPNNTDNLYTGAINISETTVLRAISYSDDPLKFSSLIETNTYFFGEDQHQIIVVSVSGTLLGDGYWPQGDDELMAIEIFTPEGTLITESQGDSNEHGNDSNAYDQRGFDYVTRDALGYGNQVQAQIISNTDRPSYERIIFKAAANDNYPFSNGGAHVRDAYVQHLSHRGNLHLDERKTESCIVYINGVYWGVYEMREKVDDIDFTDYYYNQPDGFVDFIKTWGGTWAEYGSATDWNNLVDFATTNDLSVQANYDYVLTQYNHMSLIDYFVLNSYVLCTDWLNWNTAWWRGRHPDGQAKRWRYALWDLDNTFGHGANYTGVPSNDPDADPCQVDEMGDVGGQGHVPMLNAMFDNEGFLADYLQRYAALSNTVFSCDNMHFVLDSMIAVIEPEMQRQIDRWGGNFNTWENNVQEIRDFIDARCNDEIVGGLEDCYDVTAVNVTVQIDGIGEIVFSTVDLNNETAPWSGTFFADMAINLEAITEGSGCGSFVGWQIINGDGVIAEPNSPITTLTVTTDVTVKAIFSAPANGPILLECNVSPLGAAVLEVNSAVANPLPYQSNVEAGSLNTLEATANEWFTFVEWQSLHSLLNPNENATTITINPCVADTIVAIFEEIPHFSVSIDLGDEEGGNVLFNGNPIDGPLPWTQVLEGEMNYSFTAIAEDEWSSFLHWEVNGIIMTTEELMNLMLTEDVTIVAVFDVTPHITLTVMVDPTMHGTVAFGNGYQTTTSLTVEVAANEPMDFRAIPNEYWNFKSWESVFSLPLGGAENDMTSFVFPQNDTVIAHFVKEEFAVYIPNSFTPNSDGTNDVFRPEGNAIDPEQYQLIIFNRWGEKVFETTNLNQYWEGDHLMGEHYIPDSFYHYILKAKSVHEYEVKEFKGSIYVFR
jgi:gliding motility-associated-like protein